ncbi:MAG: hypothetical protein M3Q05_10725 [Bacteroidota bacterium]|nr:hypothetical protein [Bacteroidota bacterium]
MGGVGQLSAHAFGQSAYHASLKNPKRVAIASIGNIKNNKAFIKSSTSSEKKGSDIINASVKEAEEDKLLPSKKVFESSSYFAAIFYTQALDFLLNRLNKFLAYFRQLSNFSSYPLYLIFRVFRI